jgi:hypothetical protein
VQRRWWLPFGAALGMAACCYAVNPTGSPTSANLTVSAPAFSQISMVTTTFNGDLDYVPLQCLLILDADAGFAGPLIEFDCPDAGSGSFALGDLNAQACNSGSDCTPLSGTLNVRAFTSTCPGGACGRLDADLTINSSATDPNGAPNISGTATLLGTETKDQTQCSLGGG